VAEEIKYLGNLAFLIQNIHMTDEQALISQIHNIPESLKEEVARFVSKLARGLPKNGSNDVSITRRPRKAGSRSGAYVMAPDFDDPLEDFEEYM
jgi:hypothetical protein